ncbi:uncharacterized protein LOC142219937 [Haematobia irritans]|uniref:uncharacterized protein LOC142219937 n=1 Tax=Haematobia irritans TaxID=7368 RepID=UPI003F4FD83C
MWTLLLLWLCQGTRVASLLFPAASVLQITALVSAPIEIPGRKIYWDWGIQMNYDLPYNVEKLANLPIWGDRRRRELNELDKQQTIGNQSWWQIVDKYTNGAEGVQTNKHPSDFTAGELYYDLENILTSYGYHETCLLRSVCELASHPFDETKENIITEILTFLLTPSLHEAFGDSETMYREAYETAERRGFLQHNCTQLYDECKEDLLTTLTNVVMFHNGNRDDSF